jgi:hypothetical protein
MGVWVVCSLTLPVSHAYHLLTVPAPLFLNTIKKERHCLSTLAVSGHGGWCTGWEVAARQLGG